MKRKYINNLNENIREIRRLMGINENKETKDKLAINYILKNFNNINHNTAKEIMGYAFATNNSKLFGVMLKKHGFLEKLKGLHNLPQDSYDNLKIKWNGKITTIGELNKAFEDVFTLYELGHPFLKKIKYFINDNDITDRLHYLSNFNLIWNIKNMLSKNGIKKFLIQGIKNDEKKINTLKNKIEKNYKYATKSQLEQNIENLKNKISERKYYLSEIDVLEIIIPEEEIGIVGNGMYKIKIENNKLNIYRNLDKDKNDFSNKIDKIAIIDELWRELQKYK